MPLSTKKRHEVRVGSLADQVYEYLRTAIIRGELRPGEKIVELEIAARFGTSQGPVREALQRLAYDGLVERLARRSTFVTLLRPEEMVEFFSIRRMVEGFAIKRTAETITEVQLTVLDDLVEKMRVYGRANDLDTLVDHDMAFHRQLCEWSGSTILLNTWLPLYSQIQRFIMQTHRDLFPNLVELANIHQPIVDALRKHDVAGAVQEVEDHIMLMWGYLEPRKDKR
jgi:DNA-binding GntR family transcriptional regulator